MEFENYKNYIDINKVVKIEPNTKKYIVRLELASSLITSFDQTHAVGRKFKKIDYEGKDFNYKQDIIDVINKNKDKIIKKKAHAKFTFLKLGGLSVIIGIEIEESYNRAAISKFLGNFFSRSLFHDKKWFLLANTESHLFNIRELNEYKG